jgi:hypothetical protein
MLVHSSAVFYYFPELFRFLLVIPKKESAASETATNVLHATYQRFKMKSFKKYIKSY